ncbi:MAG: S9 family peptidase [Chloroflexota bacterium]
MGDATLQWTTGVDGDRLWLRWADGGRGAFGWVGPDGAWADVLTGDRTVLGASVAADAGVIAFVAADADQPGEVAVARLDGSGERTLTDRNGGWRRDRTLGPTRRVRATGPGRTPIEAWLTLPPADGLSQSPHPTIVSIHGGPHYPVGERFSFETHRLAALGYAVLAPNPRGSLGYGDGFGRAVVGDWGGDDLRDVLALVDAAVASGDVDPSRLVVTGVSYGGYLALWAVTQDQRFRLAIAENGISDLVGAFGTGEDAGAAFASEMGGLPWERRDTWVDRSPLHHADAIRTPVLLLHAELDQNCTIAQSEQLYAALRTLGREVSFVRVPGEGHLMDLMGSARFRYARMALIEDALREAIGEP